MTAPERLEDRRRAWHESCAAGIDINAGQLAGLAADLLTAPPAATPDRGREAGGLVDGKVRAWAEQLLLERCLPWLRDGGLWRCPEKIDEAARAELVAAVRQLPGFTVELSEPPVALPLTSWAVASAVGALVGMLICTPLSYWLVGLREPGLMLGGLLGAPLLVVLVGALAHAPGVRAALSVVLATAGGVSLVTGVWQFWRGRSTGLLKAAAGALATWFVLLLARPVAARPDRAACQRDLERALRTHLRHLADLVLALCWAHPDRLGYVDAKPAREAVPLPGPVCNSLSDLRVQLADGAATPADLHDSVDELFQRLEEAGYRWESVPPGTPFEEPLRDRFNTFGLVQPGDRVRTRRPALSLDGKLVQKGELRRA